MSAFRTDKAINSVGLQRTLSLPYVILYGLGVTVGAGIYVLVGEVISRSGQHAPVSFIIAGLVMLLPAAAFAELTGRMPYAAAEAHFVGTGFNSSKLFLLVGLAVAAVGLISSAAIAHGAVGYISQLVGWPLWALLILVILATGLVSGVEIRNSIAMAGLLTLIEVGGLLAIVVGSMWSGNDLVEQAVKAVPTSLSPTLWSGIAASSLLAFFAFIGFEDIDSIAEETVNPQKTLSRGIFITLFASIAIYIAVILASLAAVPVEEIAGNRAPLTIVFSKTTPFSPLIITLIAIVATVNGIIVQLIMSARVIYGLANRGSLPSVLAKISPMTRTPLISTGVSVAIVLSLALAFPIDRLAEWTSAITLAIFMLVCAALIRIKKGGEPAPEGTFIVPVWVPYGGIVACAALLIAGLWAG
ncbi:APC family permease [Pseudahrensia aquimaris]|uniref:APC family permease n=1 Tax=Pseudahrensia aquimaris TaxID=744461 RepID=A0ABW3F977_9HYPH